MSALSNVAARAKDPAFVDLVAATLIYEARQVIAGASATNPSPVFSTSFARSIALNPLTYAGPAAWLLASDPTIAAIDPASPVSDEIIVGAVTTAWPYLARMLT